MRPKQLFQTHSLADLAQITEKLRVDVSRKNENLNIQIEGNFREVFQTFQQANESHKTSLKLISCLKRLSKAGTYVPTEVQLFPSYGFVATSDALNVGTPQIANSNACEEEIKLFDQVFTYQCSAKLQIAIDKLFRSTINAKHLSNGIQNVTKMHLIHSHFQHLHGPTIATTHEISEKVNMIKAMELYYGETSHLFFAVQQKVVVKQIESNATDPLLKVLPTIINVYLTVQRMQWPEMDVLEWTRVTLRLIQDKVCEQRIFIDFKAFRSTWDRNLDAFYPDIRDMWTEWSEKIMRILFMRMTKRLLLVFENLYCNTINGTVPVRTTIFPDRINVFFCAFKLLFNEVCAHLNSVPKREEHFKKACSSFVAKQKMTRIAELYEISPKVLRNIYFASLAVWTKHLIQSLLHSGTIVRVHDYCASSEASFQLIRHVNGLKFHRKKFCYHYGSKMARKLAQENLVKSFKCVEERNYPIHDYFLGASVKQNSQANANSNKYFNEFQMLGQPLYNENTSTNEQVLIFPQLPMSLRIL